MNYHGIEENSMLNGDGLRTVLWCAGCNHKCKGCHNPQTWNEQSGEVFDDEAMQRLLDTLKSKYVSGLTLSGGDPLFPSNREKETEIAKKVKETYPEKTIWLYTGYEFEEISDLEILDYIDVLVVGPFVEVLKDVNYEWAGSTNQRIIRKENGKWYCNKEEL